MAIRPQRSNQGKHLVIAPISTMGATPSIYRTAQPGSSRGHLLTSAVIQAMGAIAIIFLCRTYRTARPGSSRGHLLTPAGIQGVINSVKVTSSFG